MLEAYSAEDTPIEVAFEDESSGLDNYESTQLLRLSLKARNSYLELHDPHKDLDFQQKLHLQVQVQSARDLIFQCNLELTDFITECRDSSNEDRTTNKQVGEDNPLELLTLSSKSSSDPSCWFRRLATTLEAFRKTLTLREVQLTMVLFIVEHREAPDFETLYFKNYGELMSFMVPPPLTSCPINVFILEDLFRKEAQHLKTYRAEIKRLKASLEFEEREQIKLSLGRMRISNSKIKTIGEVFPWACIKDQSDLFSVSPYDIRWQRLTSEGQIKHITLADKHTLSQSFDSIKHNITTVNAAMSILDRYQQHQKKPLPERLAHILFTAAKVIRIAIFESAAKQEAEIMMAEPQETLAKEIWNLPESKRFKVFIELSLPSIKYSELFYLPRQHRQYFYERYQDCRPADLPSVAIKDKKEYLRLLTSKRPYDETIRVRINCPFQLHLNREGQHSHKSAYEKTYQGIIRLFQRRGKIPKKLIFHIHGGGFISMSSFIHQTYTRTWADNLQVPIISVDYGKAPDRPFPQGLYDCFQSYMWALHQFQQIFQAFPETVVVVGDSAGGNLAAALVTLLISWDLPPPQGLVLVYPALNLNFKNYTPSLLSALNDMILPHTFLKLCLRAYLKDERFMSDKNPFVSPILTPRSILRRYPRTQILVGNKDPFHDDCCRLVESLNEESKGLANLTVLEEFPHGFLQFDLKLFPNEFSRQATTIVQEALASLLRL